MHTCDVYTNRYSTHCTTVQLIQDFPKNVLNNIKTNCVCKTLKYVSINAELKNVRVQESISSLPIEVPHYTNLKCIRKAYVFVTLKHCMTVILLYATNLTFQQLYVVLR